MWQAFKAFDTPVNTYELTVKQVSENEKMSVAGEPRRSEDAVQDIFHKVAKLKKKTGEFLSD